MRLILAVLFMVLIAILSIPMYLVEFIIGHWNRRRMHAVAQAIVRAVFRVLLFFAGTKLTVIGKERIPKEGSVMYAANHKGIFDIIVGYAVVPNLTFFVSKKEIKKVPCINHWMKILRCQFLDREDVRGSLKVILEGIEQVKEGYSVFIMPEGTRSKTEELLPFHEGSFKYSTKSGSPIVPVALSNTDAIFERQKPWLKKAHVIVEFGEPIYPEKLSKEDKKFIGAYTRGIIGDMLNKNNKNIQF